MRWQLCPRCNGQGHTSKPHWVPGDAQEWSATSTTHTCHMCAGQGKILEAIDENCLADYLVGLDADGTDFALGGNMNQLAKKIIAKIRGENDD